MAPTIQTIDIRDCSRGISDHYPPRLEPNQVEQAWNVEFWRAGVCGRRRGTTTVVNGSQQVANLGVFTPTTSRADDRLVAFYETSPGSVTLYDANYAAAGLVPDIDDHLDFTRGVDWVNHRGKLFIAAKSDVDRMHVFEFTTFTLRRTGLAAPAAPTVANAGSGTFAGTRKYRLRTLFRLGTSNDLLRSEPSPEVAFTPSGTGAAARLTLPGVIPGVASYYEVEEVGQNGVDWYRIATVLDTVATYDDTLTLAAVAINGVLSADIGDYQNLYSAKWLAMDGDRLILGGHHTDDNLSARVAWTPLATESGIGNDERIPVDVNGFLDFDTLDGGAITALKAFDGRVIVFKNSQVHAMVRTSSRLRAYTSDTLSRRHGAIRFTVVEGTDIDGLPCLYFLDPEVGPMQLGARGLRVLAPQLQETWKAQINTGTVTQQACGVYHPEKRQVWWHIATGSSLYPDLRWMYSVESDGVVFHTIPSPVRAGISFRGKPHLGLNGPSNNVIVRADDNGTNFDWLNTQYRAYIRTRAFQPGGLIRRFNVESAVIEVEQHNDAQLYLVLIRDFSQELRPILFRPLLPSFPGGTYIILPIDNAYLSEAMTMQFEIGDVVPAPASAPTSPWYIHGLSFTIALGSPTTGRG